MISWLSSWFSGLPILNFSLPANLQGKFLSFVLKKTLGHFLTPGQLDPSQIDSQIGSGFVEITDLELDNVAIDALFSELPISFHDGHISSVSFRVPWLNPLASLKFSLESLHLTFYLASSVANREMLDLSKSMASIAESFVQDELTPNEATLLSSLNVSSDGEMDVPGGHHPNPFLSNPDDTHSFDTDPAGISMFGTLIECLLARFQFNAANTRITLIHPENMSITIHISNVCYRTVTDDYNGTAPSESANRRLITVTDVTLYSRNLRETGLKSCRSKSQPLSSFPNLNTPHFSGSDSDGGSQIAILQPIPDLPSQLCSSTSSLESTIYQSAISASTICTKPSADEELSTNITLPSDQGAEYDQRSSSAANIEGIAILSLGASPIVLELLPATDFEEIQLSITMGVAAISVSARDIGGFLEMIDVFSQQAFKTPINATNSSHASSNGFGLSVSFEVGGIVVLFLLPSLSDNDSCSKMISLSGYFDKPLEPLLLPVSYYRLFVDGISGYVLSRKEDSSKSRVQTSNISKLTNRYSASLSISDVSIFSVYKSTTSPPFYISPVLLTDPNLSTQYSTPHLHPGKCEPYPLLPKFEIIDWTNEEQNQHGVEVSAWRTRVKVESKLFVKSKSSYDDSCSKTSMSAIPAAIAVRKGLPPYLHPKSDCAENEISISIIPLHLFVDLGKAVIIEKLAAFLDEALDRQGSFVSSTGGRGFKGMTTGTITRSTRPSTSKKGSEHKVGIFAQIEMIRLQIRCPSALNVSPRSGAIVVDLHNLNIGTMPLPSENISRLSEALLLETKEHRKRRQNLLFECEFRIFIIACSLAGGKTASTIFYCGPFNSIRDAGPLHHSSTAILPALQPRLSVSKIGSHTHREFSVTSIKVDIPSVHIDVSKPLLDTIQYWVDDITQLIGATFDKLPKNKHDTDNDHKRHLMRNRSNQKLRYSGVSGYGAERTRYDLVVKVVISEALVKAKVPRTRDGVICPFVAHAIDVDLLLEMMPEGKDETVLTLSVMDLTLDRVSVDLKENFLSLTTKRCLTSIPRPMIKVRFTSLVVPRTKSKESRIKLTLWGITLNVLPDVEWIFDLGAFSKSPPGTFTSVIPSERTLVQINLLNSSIHVFASNLPGSIVFYVGDLEFCTNVIGSSFEICLFLSVPRLDILVIDDAKSLAANVEEINATEGLSFWKSSGFALIAEVLDFSGNVKQFTQDRIITEVIVDRMTLDIHICADSMGAITLLVTDICSTLAPEREQSERDAVEGRLSVFPNTQSTPSFEVMASVDDLAFRQFPEIGPAPDLINDDLPTNMDYLDESFGAAGGFREMEDGDLEEFDRDEKISGPSSDVLPERLGITSRIGGETIKILTEEGIQVLDNYFDNLPSDEGTQSDQKGATTFRLRVNDGDICLHLHDGYDWLKTQRLIQNEVKEVRRRLTKIRQLVATGQSPGSSEETSSLLFNSVHIGLDYDVDGLEPGAILTAIDEELMDDAESASLGSWQSLRPSARGQVKNNTVRKRGGKFTRSKSSSIDFCLTGFRAEVDQYEPGQVDVSRVLVKIRDVEILDHIKTSTWKKFLTELRSDSRGNIRESGSDMIQGELCFVYPVLGHPSQEARLRAKILPLRLYVDQDAVDFMKKFFCFKDPDVSPPSTSSDEIYFQHAEVFPVDLKLDYKPRRVNYRALKEGRTIELMNFFHFDGAEMTLRHITLAGITGWARFFELLNDLWTPDVKATQLVDVISGVSPIRSMVNVGSGVADLVLLPIAQYKKDGRIVRGLQKGTTAFVKSTATEAVKLGARLATGTQVILEQAEGVLGGQFQHSVTAEAVPGAREDGNSGNDSIAGPADISKYAQQPADVKEGIQSAYVSIKKNLNSAAQTILAVPMEVYERSETEGPVRAVIRAIPIAVLKPMIGASEAVSKTLLGLHNTLNPDVRRDNEAKYKR